ncbi:MAG: ABC transporter ATP-binding protein [Promethearchaeota archaeon]|nr:MAG: ABC transporter ATP-binding protein [Candidatus Lokiarchaeota archaeon]
MSSVIKLENISKVFYNKKAPEEQKEIWALNNVSFKVYEGEIFGLLGPNGAGKTTTIRCIAGILKPIAGDIYIDNEKLTDFNIHKKRKEMGFLTENHGSYEQLTLYENLRFFGGFYGIINLEERIDEVLRQIELIKRKDMKSGKLSKGQKQRLAIARAIVHEPRIIFFDEPTAGLDPVSAESVRNLILTLKKREITIFINSHNLGEVQKLCDRVAILDNGKLKRIGTPQQLSKDLWDSQELQIFMKDPIPDNLSALIKSLDYIKNSRIESNRLSLFMDDINEATPKIVKKLVTNKVNILEVIRKSRSLEDIYLKLMKDQKEELK